MSSEIIRGGPDPDEHCLHCQLVPFIDAFLKAHPEYDCGRAISDMANNLGELLGSGLYNSGRRNELEKFVADLAIKIHKSARELIETMDQGRTQ